MSNNGKDFSDLDDDDMDLLLNNNEHDNTNKVVSTAPNVDLGDSDDDLLDLLGDNMSKSNNNGVVTTSTNVRKDNNTNLYANPGNYSSTTNSRQNVQNFNTQNIFVLSGMDTGGNNYPNNLNSNGDSIGVDFPSNNGDNDHNHDGDEYDDNDDDDDDDDDILDLASKPRKFVAGNGIPSAEGTTDTVNLFPGFSTANVALQNQIPAYNNDYGYQEINQIPTQTIKHAYNKETINTFIYPTNYSVREYQLTIAKETIFQNVLATIPTGTGKTFIASVIILNYYRWFCTLPNEEDNCKIIFMAPTRPLVAQIIKACLGITGIPYNETAILLDKSRKNRETIWDEKKIFFTTPQVVENDLKRGVLNPKKIALLVIDEAHRAKGSYAYVNVAKFIERFNQSFRILALTATPSADIEGVQEVVSNLNISKIEVRTEESPDVSKYMKSKDVVKIDVPSMNDDIAEIIEILSAAALPVLREANENNLYEETDPSRINAFVALQKSNKVIANPSLPEGLKWKQYFILQLLVHVGQMLKRLKIYGVRCFYNYFTDKFKEFNAKYTLGKSKNKTAASFYFHPELKKIFTKCDELLKNPNYITHYKFRYMIDELIDFFSDMDSGIGVGLSGDDIANGNNPETKNDSRVIIFTELRESALEIVKWIDSLRNDKIKPHIFIGQSRGKENFDETEFLLKNKKKGNKKKDRMLAEKEKNDYQLEKQEKKKQEKESRTSRRTGSSEEAQVSGMNQQQQKQVIEQFKKGIYNVLVCTSIGEEGLDIGEVDLIVCFDATSSPIKNIQRMGRTGRKRDGKVVLLLSSNERTKFEKAMGTYQSLQNTIVNGHSIAYGKSDRMLPAEIQSIDKGLKIVFEKVEINETNEMVNHMEDTEEVIKFATQAMMGKLDSQKSKKRASTKSTGNGKQKKQKQFFMPEGVNGGIISAIQMLQKKSTPTTIQNSTANSAGSLIDLSDDNEDLFNVTRNSSSSGTVSSSFAPPSRPLSSSASNASSRGTGVATGDGLIALNRIGCVNDDSDESEIENIMDMLDEAKRKTESQTLSEDTFVVKNESSKETLIQYFEKNYNPIEAKMIINANFNKEQKPQKIKHAPYVNNLLKIFHK